MIRNFPNGFRLKDRSGNGVTKNISLGCYVAAALHFLRPLFEAYPVNKDCAREARIVSLLLNTKPLESQFYSDLVSHLQETLDFSLNNLGDSIELISSILKKLEKEADLAKLYFIEVKTCCAGLKKYPILPMETNEFMHWNRKFKDIFETMCPVCTKKKYTMNNFPDFFYIFFPNGCPSNSPQNNLLDHLSECIQIESNSFYEPAALIDSSGNHATALLKVDGTWYFLDSLSYDLPKALNKQNDYFQCFRKYNFKGMCLRKVSTRTTPITLNHDQVSGKLQNILAFLSPFLPNLNGSLLSDKPITTMLLNNQIDSLQNELCQSFPNYESKDIANLLMSILHKLNIENVFNNFQLEFSCDNCCEITKKCCLLLNCRLISEIQENVDKLFPCFCHCHARMNLLSFRKPSLQYIILIVHKQKLEYSGNLIPHISVPQVNQLCYFDTCILTNESQSNYFIYKKHAPLPPSQFQYVMAIAYKAL